MRARLIGREIAGAPAKVEYRRQEIGDLRTDHCEELRVLTNRVRNIPQLAGVHMRAERCKVCDILCAALGSESGGFAQREGSAELARGKIQNRVAVCPRHGENEIGIRCDSRRELSRGEVGHFTTQLLEDERRIAMNRMRDHCAGAGAGRPEFRNLTLSGVGSGESFRNWRPTDVSSANKQYVQKRTPHFKVNPVPPSGWRRQYGNGIHYPCVHAPNASSPAKGPS